MPSPAARDNAKDLPGKRLLVVLGSYRSKRHIYEHAHEAGVELVLLDGPDHWGARDSGEGRLFARHIAVDLAPLSSFVPRALGAVRDSGLRFDGVGTIEEFAGGFAARIAAALDLPFHATDAADAARDKHAQRERCAAAGIEGPGFARIESEEDLERASSVTGWPCVLKPVSGVGSVQTFRAVDLPELRAHYRKTLNEVARPRVRATGLDSDRDWFDLMWSGRPHFVLESWIDGPKYDVDVALERGEAIYGRATDDLKPCGLRDIRRAAPSGLDVTEERRLVEHATRCVRAIGFTEGIFNVEVKRTVDGPRTIEVNGRLGGYSTVDVHRAVWGVDLVNLWLRSCLRLPLASVVSTPSCHVAESLLPAPRSGTVERDGFLEVLRTMPDVIAQRQWMFSGDVAQGVETLAPDWLGAVVVRGSTRAEALARLDEALSRVELPVRDASPARSECP